MFSNSRERERGREKIISHLNQKLSTSSWIILVKNIEIHRFDKRYCCYYVITLEDIFDIQSHCLQFHRWHMHRARRKVKEKEERRKKERRRLNFHLMLWRWYPVPFKWYYLTFEDLIISILYSAIKDRTTFSYKNEFSRLFFSFFFFYFRFVIHEKWRFWKAHLQQFTFKSPICL